MTEVWRLVAALVVGFAAGFYACSLMAHAVWSRRMDRLRERHADEMNAVLGRLQETHRAKRLDERCLRCRTIIEDNHDPGPAESCPRCRKLFRLKRDAAARDIGDAVEEV